MRWRELADGTPGIVPQYIRAWMVVKLLVSDHFLKNLNPAHQPRNKPRSFYLTSTSLAQTELSTPTIKMQFSTLALASLLSVASARISGIAVPKTIRAGYGFNAIILTEGYIQSVNDVAIAFGVAPGTGYPGSLGTTIESFYLGPRTLSPQNPLFSGMQMS